MVLPVTPVPRPWWLAAPAALVLAAVLPRPGNGDASRSTDVVRVVDVQAVAATPVPGGKGGLPTPGTVAVDPPAETAMAGGDVAAMGELAHTQPRDARAVGDEVQLGTAVARALAVSPPRVSCTITLCAVEGRDALPPAALEAALQAAPLLDALAAIGYSPGPARVGAGAAKDGFLLFLNRET